MNKNVHLYNFVVNEILKKNKYNLLIFNLLHSNKQDLYL